MIHIIFRYIHGEHGKTLYFKYFVKVKYPLTCYRTKVDIYKTVFVTKFACSIIWYSQNGWLKITSNWLNLQDIATIWVKKNWWNHVRYHCSIFHIVLLPVGFFSQLDTFYRTVYTHSEMYHRINTDCKKFYVCSNVRVNCQVLQVYMHRQLQMYGILQNVRAMNVFSVWC